MRSLPEAALDEISVEPEGSGNDSLRPYSQILAIFLCGSFAFLDLYCTQPLLPLLSRVFRASETSASLTISAPTFGVAISAALLAMFAERVDRKRMIVGSTIALAIVTVLTATAQNLYLLVAWRFLQGLLTPGIFIITIAYVTEEWSGRLAPRVMSVYVAGTVFGGFLSRFAGGILAEHYSWQFMFVVLGIAGAVGAAVTQRILKPAVQRPSLTRGQSRFSPMLANLRNPRLLATFGVGFCMLFALVSEFSYITFYLAGEPFHLSTAALGRLFSVYLVGLLATLAAGTVLAGIGLRRGIVGAITLCLAGAVLTVVPSLIAVGIGLSLASAGIFIAQTCASSFLREAAPQGARVSAAGIYICSYYVGGTAGGVLPGLLWKHAGWPGCVALICCFLIMAGLTAYFGWRPRLMEPDPAML